MPSASANAMPMKSVAVWPPAADGLRRAPREEVAGHVAHTDGCGARADGCEAGTDELTHLSDIAFHIPVSLRWNVWMSVGDLSARDAAHP